MKKIKLIIVFLLIGITSFSQEVFNRIILDTTNQIVTGVVATDTGFVFVAGTDNEFGIRSFAFTAIDLDGDKIWKKIYGDTQIIFSEGWFDNIQSYLKSFSLCGVYINPNDGYRGVHISFFDSCFNLDSQKMFLYDSFWKQPVHHIRAMDSCYYVTGQIDTSDNGRLLLLKADSVGNFLWFKVFGNNAYEYGSTILGLSNGTILSGGISWITGDNNTRWYFVNTDTSGNLIWEKNFGRANYRNGHVKSMCETNESNILACGSYPVARFGSGDGETLLDACLRKIDTNGNLLWERLYRNFSCYPDGTGITLSSAIKSIIQLENGDYIMIGSSYWYYSRHRGFMLKTDSEGNVKWHRYYYAVADNSRWQYFSSFKPTTDGGYIIAGYGDDYSNLGYDPPQQAWLVKTDSLGMDGLCNVEPDALNFDFDIQEVPEGICMNDTIEVYVHIAGKSAPYTIEFSTGQVIDSIYYPPTFVPVEIGLTDINLTWGGETYFEESITEATLSNHEWGQCIVKPVEFFTPSTWGPQQLQITVTDAYGESKTITKEIFAVQCTSENVSSEATGFKIYPNPASDILNIEVPEQNFSNAEIFDLSGQSVLSVSLNQGNNKVDTRNLLPGSYLVKLSGKNGRIETRIFEKI
ncbi:MAG: T9SS type A sorting domain-containing protein [Bacteroidales bacterium]|nr:T9SS type A sorting domain-containing protein [Bacteroidales bacterium]